MAMRLVELARDADPADTGELQTELRELSPELGDILDSEAFSFLKGQERHRYTDAYDHSVRTAWLAMRLAESNGLDAVSAAKTALLHDFCDRESTDIDVSRTRGSYFFFHPFAAARNAEAYFGVTKREKRAIRSHMFPGFIIPPTSRLGWAVVRADKVATYYEFHYLPR